MSGGGSSSTTNTEPWGEQQPYLKDIFKQAQGFYQNENLWPSYYWGPTTAPFNPMEMTALQQQAQTAFGPMPQQAANLANANQWTLGPAMYAESNPYLEGYINAAIEPTVRQFNESVLPNIRSGAVQAGQYGGSRQGIAEGLAMDRLQQNMLNTTAGITQDQYRTAYDNLIKAQALTPQVMQTGLMPGQVLAQVGSGLRQMDQQFINDYMARHGYNENLPLEMLSYYNNLIQGGYGGLTTSGMNQSLGSQLAGGLGAGLGTYGMLTSLGPAALAAPQFAIPAALAMGALSFL